VLAEFLLEVAEHFFPAVTAQVILEAAQRDPDHIAMMDAGTEALLHAKPEVVGAVEVLGP
jgi:hypothetical protein